jgi:Cysteine rich repeat
MVKAFYALGSRGRAQCEGNMLGRFLLAGLITSCALLVPAKAQAQGLEDIRTYCVSDIKRLCTGIEPGAGRLIKCLKAHKKEMSVGCAQALQKLKAKKQ